MVKSDALLEEDVGDEGAAAGIVLGADEEGAVEGAGGGGEDDGEDGVALVADAEGKVRK